ncbi:MAG: DUF4236 domain-containing protein [Alphaproteobacteria bacterium PRO2]|nr:DUF4236 domain-containing protein [Alphaproteobacteria bacterium PRO2]
MGFRFRKSIKIIPGIRLNLSKSGPSVSVGGKGLTYNVSKKGTRTTVGIPGTGLSHSTYKANTGKRNNSIWLWLGILAIILIIAAIAG